MKILLQQFLSRNHSWSIVGQNIARSLIKQGHNVHLFSTNGLQYFPDDLKSNLIGYFDDESKKAYGRNPDNDYDCQISYTAMRNFQNYLSHGNRNRFGIYCYEWPILPNGFAKYHQYTDLILAPSEFAKECFMNSRVPEHKIKVIPHGIDLDQFSNTNKYKLKTKKKIILFCNIGQAHRRKNIDGMFNAYHKAFTKNDDICLVAKISKNQMKNPFDVDPIKIYNEIKSRTKNPPEVELITEYIPNIVELYNACDYVYTLTHCEGYYMPGHEALAAGKTNICPKYGGQLDFLNDDNAILIDGSLSRAPLNEQYWTGDVRNTHFDPSVDDAVAKLRYAYKNYDELKNKLSTNKDNIEKYSWNCIVNKIMELIII